MAGQPRRRPVRAVPDPRQLTNPYYDGQLRVMFGGEPFHLTLCGTCAAVVPSGSKAQERHTQWHRLMQEALDAALPR